MLAMDIDVVVPGHGPVTDRAGVVAVRDYLEFVDREATDRHAAGVDAFDAAREIARLVGARDDFRTWSEFGRIAVNVDTAYRSLDRVEPRNLRGWFVRIGQNAARDALRRERRRPTLPLGPLESTDGSDRRGVGVEPVADASSDPQLAAERRELAEELSAALAQIPEERRTAILLYDVDGFDYAEIAELTGCSVGTVKSRISRGREELRRLLGGREAGTRQGPRSLRGRDD